MALDEKIDVKRVLHVFQKILAHGKLDKTKDVPTHQLEGIYATSDFDGYNVVLFNDYVTLTIQFHSKYSFDFTNRRERMVFLQKLDHIFKAYGDKP